ncbi:hypothetical protein H0H93_013896 [Arthromyces matolae]|nr:hypothetical protein H0H93_013896 [Arthromyces matolae]
MAKKGKDDGPNTNAVPNRDILQRLIPGSTATVRIKKSPIHGHLMVYTCTGCKTSRKIPAPPTLKTDDNWASNDLTSSAPGAAVPDTTASGTLASAMTGIETQSDAAQEKHDLDSKKGARKKRRRNAQARVPPLFARDIGHVVYCGNEKLVDNGFGDGVYIT